MIELLLETGIRRGLLPALSAHDFRHTFADRFLAYLVEKRGHDLARPQTNSDESAAGLTLRRCHFVMQVVI